MYIVTFKTSKASLSQLDIIAMNFFEGNRSLALRYAIKKYLTKAPTRKELENMYKLFGVKWNSEERVVTFKLDEEDLKILHDAVDKYGLTFRSDAIRLAMYRLIQDKMKEIEKPIPRARMTKIKI